MPLIPGLSPAWLTRLTQMSRWQTNVRITGPGVSMTNTPDGMSVYIGQQPTSPTARNQAPQIFWGSLTALWTPGSSTINLQPTSGPGGANTGATIDAVLDFGAPVYCGFTVGEAIAYYRGGTSYYAIGNCVPPPNALYQVLQNIGNVANVQFDFLRAT